MDRSPQRANSEPGGVVALGEMLRLRGPYLPPCFVSPLSSYATSESRSLPPWLCPPPSQLMRATSLILWFGLPVFTVASGCRSNEAGSPTASKAMTVEWIYTEGRTADDLPKSAWRADGQAILLDVCTPAEAPTLELLDPSTGERRPMVDASRARKSLLALVDVDLEGDWLWPDSFDRAPVPLLTADGAWLGADDGALYHAVSVAGPWELVERLPASINAMTAGGSPSSVMH